MSVGTIKFNFLSMWFLARLLGREHWRHYISGALQKDPKNLVAKICFMFDLHRITLQRLVEVAQKVPQRIKRGKSGRKKNKISFSDPVYETWIFGSFQVLYG